jgi:UPF0755 protein
MRRLPKTITRIPKNITRGFTSLVFSVGRVVRPQFWTRGRIQTIAVGIVCLVVVGGLFTHRTLSAPNNFVVNTLFTIEDGMTLDEVAHSLKSEGYIRSDVTLKLIVKAIFKNENGVTAGDYSFERPLSVVGVAKRILAGDFHLDPVRVTVPEGLNKYETADLLVKRLPHLNKEEFIAVASEGYLFPDTYFFPPNITPEKIVEVMRGNFDRRVATLEDKIAKFGRPLDDVITMASIVETEARKFDTRQKISDILWRRLNEGMPLQVDVSFKYINGKTTFDLTLADLTLDSPYNTYKYAGLPPTPIANPGLDSILATVTPHETKFYFFLSDENGEMHYAETFDDHIANKRKYLQ